MSDVHVIICGLPRSGNHLIRDVLRKCKISCEIEHAEYANIGITAGGHDRVVLLRPVRDLFAWDRSVRAMYSERHWARYGGGPDGMRAIYNSHICKAVARWPFLEVSYEAICQHPQTQFRAILFWMGIDPDSVDQEILCPVIFDGNQKYYTEGEGARVPSPS